MYENYLLPGLSYSREQLFYIGESRLSFGRSGQRADVCSQRTRKDGLATSSRLRLFVPSLFPSLAR